MLGEPGNLAEISPAGGHDQQRTSDCERDARDDHPFGCETKQRYLGRYQPDAGENDEQEPHLCQDFAGAIAHGSPFPLFEILFRF